ncbi:MAG: alpha/beta hydrolase [Bacteroidota bacterium]
MKHIALLSFFLFLAGALSGQSTLPEMKDWFMSVGEWGSSPELYVAEFGSGSDTVVFLHGGWGGHHRGLIAATAGLEGEFHFVLYDQRGSIYSPCPDTLVTFDSHIQDLERLRRELGLRRLSIVGHSMGAVLACAYAERYPDRVRRLTLVSPANLRNPLSQKEDSVANAQFEAHRALMESGRVAEELQKFGLSDGDLMSKGQTALFRVQFANRFLYDITKWPSLTGGRSLYQGQIFELTAQTYPKGGWDYVTELSSQSYPVNLIIGSHDFLDFGNGLISGWADRIDRAQFYPIPNAGHMVWLDQPDAFREALRSSLR